MTSIREVIVHVPEPFEESKRQMRAKGDRLSMERRGAPDRRPKTIREADCNKASAMAFVALHPRARYVSKAAI